VDELALVAPRALLDIQPKIIGLLGTPGRRSLVSQLGQKPAYLRPIVDGDLIPELPFDAVAGGAGSDVELLAGCTSQETNFVARIFARWVRADGLRRGLGNLGLGSDQIETYLAAQGRRARREILGQAMTDRSFRMPVARLAEARGEGAAATYCYEFGWQSPAFHGVLGAIHGLTCYSRSTISPKAGRGASITQRRTSSRPPCIARGPISSVPAIPAGLATDHPAVRSWSSTPVVRSRATPRPCHARSGTWLREVAMTEARPG
jgi:hypothetical protein